MEKRLQIFNWPLLSPRRPRCPSSIDSSSAFSSRVPSFSSDVTEFYDVTEDWSENMEQGGQKFGSTTSVAACYCHDEEGIHDYCHATSCIRDKIFQSPKLKAFTFKELECITGNFDRNRIIGEGVFYHVYKGWIDEETFTASRPESGMPVAVKIWDTKDLQGHLEWQTEVRHLGQLHHPNIVKLIGFCSECDSTLLVYEYVQGGSLANLLFGSHPFSWASRIKVAIDVAKALSFLHDAESPTIVRDMKSSNVLLDTEFNAKLTDFSLAIAGPTEDKTHVSTTVMGTCGYADPEYTRTGNLSIKSDVYGFGVVLLELLSGLRAFDKTRHHAKRSLVDWAKPYLGYKRKLTKFMDPNLEGQYPKEGANAVAKLALQCLTNHPKLRPCMSEVLTALERVAKEHMKASEAHDDQTMISDMLMSVNANS